MAEFTTTKLNAESHLLLDQPLLRLPHELARKNFKTVQKHFERERDVVLSSLKSTANASLAGQDSSQTLNSLDGMINRMQGLKRKMESLHDEEKVLHQHSRKRIQHLQDLYDIPSLADVKYDEWSRIRLNRLLVDYLLRSGCLRSVSQDRGEPEEEEYSGVPGLVFGASTDDEEDQRTIIPSMLSVTASECLHEGVQNNLEFELRLQQYIELRRNGRLLDARQHAQKYIAPHTDTHLSEIHRAAGLLAYPPNTQAEPYKTMYSQSRWDFLATLFVKTHNELFSLPARPLLHIALSAGLSALKTPACHSKFASSSSNASSSTTSVCPICSTELKDLARNLPYAHHTKSNVESDPIVLPNGRVYGRERVLQVSAKAGLDDGRVKDPTTGDIFEASKIRKVYIS
ncbi:GID complex subunit containing RING finger motif [Toensbergia leucococca]|nr:GID complex subunit containing RING finger motif [Toensbergia leucococca]